MARQAVLQPGSRPATYGRLGSAWWSDRKNDMPAAPADSTRSRSSAWSTTQPTPRRRRPRAEGGDASTVGGWTLKGGRNPSTMGGSVGPSAEKKQRSKTPGPYKARGPTTRPPEAPRNSHFSQLRVNRQHQTERSGKGTAFGCGEVGDVLSDLAITCFGAPRGFGPPELTGAPSGLPPSLRGAPSRQPLPPWGPRGTGDPEQLAGRSVEILTG
jgi:hypothetical protein